MGNRSALQRWRVPMGFLSVAVFLVLSRPTWSSIVWGLPLTAMGLSMRAWASGHLRKNASLATSGPYAFTRNPLYLGSLSILIGVLVAGGNWWLGAVLIILFLLVYYPVMRKESAHMQDLFKDDYRRWALEVPLFVPRLLPSRSLPSGSYDVALYLKHREYRSLIGTVALYGALLAKLLLRIESR